jgi:hypothetical protein
MRFHSIYNGKVDEYMEAMMEGKYFTGKYINVYCYEFNVQQTTQYEDNDGVYKGWEGWGAKL